MIASPESSLPFSPYPEGEQLTDDLPVTFISLSESESDTVATSSTRRSTRPRHPAVQLDMRQLDVLHKIGQVNERKRNQEKKDQRLQKKWKAEGIEILGGN